MAKRTSSEYQLLGGTKRRRIWPLVPLLMGLVEFLVGHCRKQDTGLVGPLAWSRRSSLLYLRTKRAFISPYLWFTRTCLVSEHQGCNVSHKCNNPAGNNKIHVCTWFFPLEFLGKALFWIIKKRNSNPIQTKHGGLAAERTSTMTLLGNWFPFINFLCLPFAIISRVINIRARQTYNWDDLFLNLFPHCFCLFSIQHY